ncbi:MAG: F0F1 ATP synthase subunit delta [Alphaproteobacteria bacterium]|nr:F0F1 ATP synthase subunit delta [Alphaproteobacteria bacterium]
MVAVRYASAFLDMAADQGVVQQVENDMRELAVMLAGSQDLQALINNPLVSRAHQSAAIQALCQQAKFHDLTARFLGVLAQNRRLRALEGIMKAFAADLRRRRGEVQATVQTAYALTPAQTKELQEQLTQAMGTNVTLDVSVNKDLLGGMTVTVGSRMIDDSVRSKLERLQRAMTSGSNQNQHIKEVG